MDTYLKTSGYDLKINNQTTYEKYFHDLILIPSWGKAHLLPSYATKEDIEAEVKKKIDEVKNRVDEIEKRFPKEATLEKIASVNDAILGTNVETLAESIKRIEEKLLTKWDIAKIVFEILAALGVLIGLTFAILKYIQGS